MQLVHVFEIVQGKSVKYRLMNDLEFAEYYDFFYEVDELLKKSNYFYDEDNGMGIAFYTNPIEAKAFADLVKNA